MCRITMRDCQKSIERRQIVVSHRRVFRKALLQILCECLGSLTVPCDGKRECGSEFHVTAGGNRKSFGRGSRCHGRIAEESLPNRYSGFIVRRPLSLA